MVEAPFIIANEDGASSLCPPIAEREDCHEERRGNGLEEIEAVLNADLWEVNRNDLNWIML